MTPDEAIEVLTRAAAYDQRTIGRADGEAWAAALPDIHPDRAIAAVVAWYGAHRERVMPADVRDHCRGSETDRHPAYRPLGEAVAASDRKLELPAATPEQAAAAKAEIAALCERISAKWAAPSPTGFVGARARHSPRREPTGPTPAGLTICHRCAGDMRAPAGWDPASTTAVALFCPRCTVAVAADRKAAG